MILVKYDDAEDLVNQLDSDSANQDVSLENYLDFLEELRWSLGSRIALVKEELAAK